MQNLADFSRIFNKKNEGQGGYITHVVSFESVCFDTKHFTKKSIAAEC